jgi:hypothetical protein
MDKHALAALRENRRNDGEIVRKAPFGDWCGLAVAASAGNNAGSRCRGFVAPCVLTSQDFRCTEARCSVFVLMSITTVDYEDIGDNYNLCSLAVAIAKIPE